MPVLIFACLISCQFNSGEDDNFANAIYESDIEIEIENAKGFNISQNDSFLKLNIQSLSSTYPFSDSLIFPKIKLNRKQDKRWQPLWNRFACQSTTHLTFLNALGRFSSVLALSDIKYMPKDDIYERVAESGVQELNVNNSVDIEKLVNLQTDLFFMYPFEWEVKKYKEAEIKTLLIAEYLEHTAIARLEWIKVFGLLVGEEKLADSIFSAIKTQYQKLQLDQNGNKTAFFNVPFKELWDMPAPNSITANLIKDAGFTYVFDSQTESIDNISMLKESVWAKVYAADYWIIIADRQKDFTLNDLIAEEEVYSTFKAVQKKQVIFCNTSQSSYFTQGILEPHIMLKDLLFLTNNIKEHSPKYFHLLK